MEATLLTIVTQHNAVDNNNTLYYLYFDLFYYQLNIKKDSEILNFYILRNHEHITLLLYKTIKLNGHRVVFGQLVQNLEQNINNTKQFYSSRRSQCTCSIWTAGSKVRTKNTKQFYSTKTIKMNGHSVVFGQLVQKLEQTTPNSSTLQDDQNEWSQCSI